MANPLQFLLEGISSGDRIQQLHAPLAAKRNEVHAALALVSNWFDLHFGQIVVRAEGPPSRKKRGKGGATLFWEFPALGNTRERTGRPHSLTLVPSRIISLLAVPE